ncbi:MAG: adenylosuccinate synthase [Gammaproteobacteria bacterium]|nr:adenylosuccinate synthase [Gammaproteobacteria bacterium]HJL96461.1 adenylosuccinate synthase [SAR86 cluster bacterium]HJM59160.1 adenylosuccinate synthase [SAR86 cluster bacterium]|tara:strand:+ start:8578 stop:9861 length:1284 start_codon:yes stop_codon:yes gene_type:complete
MSKTISLLGLQWGDEGKGKVVDHLAKDLDAAIRYQGGHNAGHTLIVDGKKIVFHLLPSAICHEDIHCYIGRGVVVSLDALFEEIEEAQELIGNIEDRLTISLACSLIQPYHIKLDQLRESSNKSTKIGTTGRGIGTAYEDRVGRRSVRVIDLFNEDNLKSKLEEALDFYNSIFKHSFGSEEIDLNELFDKNLQQGEKLKPYVGNVIQEVRDLQDKGKKILFEGAQGALLDVSLGTYPYVTSSNSSVSGIASGVGISPTDISYSLGIAKAYATRVGEGPFPTELFDETGAYLAEKGGEVGATTGRPRRCGWLDTVLLSNVVRLNGIDGLCITKIDVLDGLDSIKICTDYKSNLNRDEMIETMLIEDVIPVYTELEGWEEPTEGIQNFDELNQKAKDFIQNIEEICNVPVIMISTGPKREDTIIREYPL